MQMIHCPNCGKLSGFKRSLGFGTLFMVVITGGLWLLMIPLYPSRCINCGMRRAPAQMQNFADWLKTSPMGAVVSVCILVGICAFMVSSVLKAHNSAPAQRSTSDEPAAIAVSSPPEDHALHLLPNLSGRGAVSDGRTYSVGLLAAYQGTIPPGTELFTQGIFAGISYRGAFGMESPWDIVFVRDERDKRRALACLVDPEEIEGHNFPYHEGDRIQVHGISYVAYGYDGFINFRQCQFSSPTDNVVQLESVGSGASIPAVQQSTPNAQAPDAQDQPQQALAVPETQPSISNRSESSNPSVGVEQLEQRRESLAARAISVSNGLHEFRESQTAQGWTLPSDILASQQRMQARLYEAKSALKEHDVSRSRECLNRAEIEVVNLEKYLGVRMPQM